MIANVTSVFQACAAATGRPFHAPMRQTVTKCPMHDDRTASLSIREALGSWKCFGSCQTQGGVLDVPIFFEIIRATGDKRSDHSEAAKWLSDRGLIPPADSSKSTHERAFVAPRVYIDNRNLPEDLAYLRTCSHCLLIEEVGYGRYRGVRDVIAIERAIRETQFRIAKRELFQLLALGFVIERYSLAPDGWINSSEARKRAAALFPDLFAEAA